MALHLRLLQIEMYLPNVASETELIRALGPLKRLCKNRLSIALAIEHFTDSDRGRFSIIVTGTEKTVVEHESDQLLDWIESQIQGQSLSIDVNWL